MTLHLVLVRRFWGKISEFKQRTSKMTWFWRALNSRGMQITFFQFLGKCKTSSPADDIFSKYNFLGGENETSNSAVKTCYKMPIKFAFLSKWEVAYNMKSKMFCFEILKWTLLWSAIFYWNWDEWANISVSQNLYFFMEMKFPVLALLSSFQLPLDVTDRCLLKRANYLCT